MNSEQTPKRQPNVMPRFFSETPEMELSDQERLKFTNRDIVVRDARSETLNDGLTDQNEILQSEIIEKPQDDFEDDEENSSMFRSMKVSQKQSMKKSSKMKKKNSLNLNTVLQKIIANDFINGQDKSQPQGSNPKMSSLESPTKLIVINTNMEKIVEEGYHQTSILLDHDEEKSKSEKNEKKVQKNETETDYKQIKKTVYEGKEEVKTKQNDHNFFMNPILCEEEKSQKVIIHQTNSQQVEKSRSENVEDILKTEQNHDKQEPEEEFKICLRNPQQIPLPLQKYEGEPFLEVNFIIPCTLTSAPRPSMLSASKNSEKKEKSEKNVEKKESRRKQTQESIIIAHDLKQQVKEEEDEITKKLLHKIENLEQKISVLENEKEQRKVQEQMLMKKSEVVNYYKSTPHKKNWGECSGSPGAGSIRKNQIPKNYASSETNETSNMFRMRMVPKVHPSPNKLQSNVFNLALSEPGSNDDIREQLSILKNKLALLQNSQSFNHQGYETPKEEKHLTPFQPSLESPDRKELKGRIVRKFGSRFVQDSNNFEDVSQHSAQIVPTPKGFKRNQVKHEIKNNSKAYEGSRYSNGEEYEESGERKRVDSSAIFKKNPKSSQNTSQKKENNLSKQPNTLQFNTQKEKFVILDSRDTETLFLNNHKREPISPIERFQSSDVPQIQIPEFDIVPEPQHHSEELIEIGKLAFRKMNCQINDNTILNVKKYRNCVHFGISNEHNILWHYEGRFYFGGWKPHPNGEGQKNGQGLEFYPGKYKFKGYFSDGKRNGFGILIMQNGTKYIGQWAEGLKHGQGKQIDDDGYIYRGEWISGKRNGCGKIYSEGRLEFDGVFNKGLKHGHGKEYFENGDTYEGEYVEGKFHGKGTYKWHTGAHYTGEFFAGQRNGHGIWRSAAIGGDTYEGEYKQDKKHGFGVYKWSNGSIYEGSFKNDLKHGEGTITYENGKVAHMCWKNGQAVKKVEMSSRIHSSSKNKKTTQIPQNPPKRDFIQRRSTEKLQSAKSTNSLGERRLPRGLSFKPKFQSKQETKHQTQHEPKHDTRRSVQHQNRYQTSKKHGKQSYGQSALKLKLGPQFERTKILQRSNVPKDPPYRGMQTTSNINMNI